MMRYLDPAGRMGATRDFSDLGRNGAAVYSKIRRPGGTGADLELARAPRIIAPGGCGALSSPPEDSGACELRIFLSWPARVAWSTTFVSPKENVTVTTSS